MPAPRSASQPSYMPAGGSRPARPRAPEDAYFPRQPTYAAATLPSGRRDLYDDPQAEREREQVFRRGDGGEHNPYDFVSTPTAPRPQARPQPSARGAAGGAGLYGQLRVPRSGSGVSLSSDDGDSSLRGGAASRPGMSRTASNSRGGRPGQMSRGRDEVDGLGMNEMNSHDPYSSHSGYNSYAHESPTHAYLEAFESYTHLPDPKHTLIRPSPSITSLGGGGGSTAGEKDGASLHEAARYDSNHYLSASDSRRNLSGAMGQSSSKPSEYGAVGGARGSGNAGYTKSFSDAAAPAAKKRRGGCAPQSKRNRRLLFWGLPALIVIIGAVVVGVLFATKKVGSGATGSGGANGTNGTGNGGVVQGPVPYNASLYGVAGNGTNGSTVTTDLGVKFTYINPFGGNWAMDPLHPYQVGGRAQSWSPTVNENWIWGQHIVRGVNLGGWLVTEPFIVPGLYEQYQTGVVQAIDEYTLSQAMGANLSVAMEEHYRTFITEQDFADIAKVGLNWVRIPIGYWAIEAHYGEPYLQAVAWKYFVKAIGWARKYGLRILLDYHALPGSQNGWNHSGRGIGITNWMYGVMGITNAERSLEQLRLMTEFISQDGIKQVVPAISLVNEVMNTVVGDQNLRTFYYKAYNLIRGLTGVGAGNGPIIAIHEGFEGIAAWTTFLKGADRLALDQHPYLAFAGQNLDGHAVKQRIACSWGGGTNDTSSAYGIVLGGEWSNAINDCGKWLNGVNGQSGYNTIPGSLGCDYWEQWMKWNDTLKADINSYCQANMDALQNWFFWTWKIGNSTQAGFPTSPMWHYKLGVEQGWIPADPRGAGGHCQAIGVGGNQFDGKYPASAIGSASSQTLQNTTMFTAWPPTSLGPNFTDTAQIARFPTLTQTGAPLTLATAVHPANVSIGNGWAYSTDTTKAWVTVAGCTYPDAYNATASALVPATACTGSGGGKRSLAAGNEKRIPLPPRITPPPTR